MRGRVPAVFQAVSVALFVALALALVVPDLHLNDFFKKLNTISSSTNLVSHSHSPISVVGVHAVQLSR